MWNICMRNTQLWYIYLERKLCNHIFLVTLLLPPSSFVIFIVNTVPSIIKFTKNIYSFSTRTHKIRGKTVSSFPNVSTTPFSFLFFFVTHFPVISHNGRDDTAKPNSTKVSGREDRRSPGIARFKSERAAAGETSRQEKSLPQGRQRSYWFCTGECLILFLNWNKKIKVMESSRWTSTLPPPPHKQRVNEQTKGKSNRNEGEGKSPRFLE